MIRDEAEQIARLYSEGLNCKQIAKVYNVDSHAMSYHLRRLIELGLPRVRYMDEDKRERAWFKTCCALHLADLHRHHGKDTCAPAA
jgi:hypothetical protein